WLPGETLHQARRAVTFCGLTEKRLRSKAVKASEKRKPGRLAGRHQTRASVSNLRWWVISSWSLRRWSQWRVEYSGSITYHL
ncbi:unnamed protein product, partial [Gulo gulo]